MKPHVKYDSGLKVLAKVKFVQKYLRLQGHGHKVKIMVPCKRSCQKEYTIEIWKPYL